MGNDIIDLKAGPSSILPSITEKLLPHSQQTTFSPMNYPYDKSDKQYPHIELVV